MKLSDNQRWFTPTWVLDKVAETFGSEPDCDPCWDPESHVSAKIKYDAREGQNGLVLPWSGSCFVNPPYDAPAPWALRSLQHVAADPAHQVIMLLNSAPGTDWWHEFIWPTASIAFLRGRLRFGRPAGFKVSSSPNPHESSIVYFGPHHDRFKEVWRHVGRVVQPELAIAA